MYKLVLRRGVEQGRVFGRVPATWIPMWSYTLLLLETLVIVVLLVATILPFQAYLGL